ncbi:MAG: FMN-binding negative transcriptional regulator [Gammaproteobacteria bacterium]|nr:FMN-binding negative transcriptional regulator [Gammaproteobacteria bacterium]
MYLPKHFEVINNDEIFAFMHANSFGQLISNVDGRLFSTHIPFLIRKEESKLVGHLARANPQHKTIEGQEILVTMQGAHDYISPSWFETPGVPTWNYQAVHVYGHCEVIEEPEHIADIVNSLTHKHESAFDKPWQPEYRESMLKAIVGIEITISEIQAKYKLSQNRSEQDQKQIVEGLETKGSMGLAREMRRA